ncbi:peroxide stress protein YaaA [uncultured Clostridium sp.]|mgnify:CR=1 FL=1|uniref:peroxide stress protein YaaA n=1 Tax=uncultured Clostridium sp. TaxID=59620 RepID=UPI0025D24F1A|nr:peroxide stress protein YaaA [uncultured Clostridium sp.]
MIVVLSPAKTLEVNESFYNFPMTEPQFLDEAEILVKELRKYDGYSLSTLMKTSSKLAELSRERFEVWSRSLDNAHVCLGSFKGEAYRGLDAGSYSMEDMFYANDHLRILSGLYGVLRPFDGINFYRLEMGTKFKFDRYKNLYDYWKDKVGERIYEDVIKNEDKTLVNLASNEYFKCIEHIGKFDNINIITPVFKENKNGQYKVVSTKAKRARGLMTSFIMKNKITDKEELKKFNYEGYEYDEELSSDNMFVFTRENGGEEREEM